MTFSAFELLFPFTAQNRLLGFAKLSEEKPKLWQLEDGLFFLLFAVWEIRRSSQNHTTEISNIDVLLLFPSPLTTRKNARLQLLPCFGFPSRPLCESKQPGLRRKTSPSPPDPVIQPGVARSGSAFLRRNDQHVWLYLRRQIVPETYCTRRQHPLRCDFSSASHMDNVAASRASSNLKSVIKQITSRHFPSSRYWLPRPTIGWPPLDRRGPRAACRTVLNSSLVPLEPGIPASTLPKTPAYLRPEFLRQVSTIGVLARSPTVSSPTLIPAFSAADFCISLRLQCNAPRTAAPKHTTVAQQIDWRVTLIQLRRLRSSRASISPARLQSLRGSLPPSAFAGLPIRAILLRRRSKFNPRHPAIFLNCPLLLAARRHIAATISAKFCPYVGPKPELFANALVSRTNCVRRLYRDPPTNTTSAIPISKPSSPCCRASREKHATPRDSSEIRFSLLRGRQR